MSKKFLGLFQLILVIGILIGAFAISAWLSSLREGGLPSVTIQEREMVVTAQRIEPLTYRVHFETTGNVQARSPVAIVPLVSGKVIEVSENLYPGGAFKKDEPLFKIEPDDFENEIDRLKAELARAKTLLELEQAETNAAIAEWRSLNPSKDVPPLVARKPQLKEAKANADSAKAQLATAKLNLVRTVFSLPFDGRVTNVQIEKGQFVSLGASLGEAYSLEGIEISVPLEDKEYGWLKESTAPDITIRTSYLGQNHSIKARIKRLAAQYDPTTRLTNVVLKPEDTKLELIPNIFVDVDVIGPTRNNIWLLPINALQEDSSIWEIRPDNTLQRRQPDILNITKDYAAAYSDGTTINVVTGALPQATQGAKVRLKSTFTMEKEDK